ncbi:unannotated protein [freshwater metagenome]|uniref:Unannotated protein n=1 Tax=freshwater metagenome TaxID=449393 RepID=A0A6J7DW86_9ZZZZ
MADFDNVRRSEPQHPALRTHRPVRRGVDGSIRYSRNHHGRAGSYCRGFRLDGLCSGGMDSPHHVGIAHRSRDGLHGARLRRRDFGDLVRQAARTRHGRACLGECDRATHIPSSRRVAGREHRVERSIAGHCRNGTSCRTARILFHSQSPERPRCRRLRCRTWDYATSNATNGCGSARADHASRCCADQNLLGTRRCIRYLWGDDERSRRRSLRSLRSRSRNVHHGSRGAPCGRRGFRRRGDYRVRLVDGPHQPPLPPRRLLHVSWNRTVIPAVAAR